MSENGKVLIGTEGSDHVSITLRGRRSFEGWSGAEVEIQCDSWIGHARACFMKGELARFAKDIRRLHSSLSGTAVLQPLEPNIVLELTGDGKGRITVEGEAQNNFASGTKLIFRFKIDQTFLRPIAAALDHAESLA
jgi:hypothetical protein